MAHTQESVTFVPENDISSVLTAITIAHLRVMGVWEIIELNWLQIESLR